MPLSLHALYTGKCGVKGALLPAEPVVGCANPVQTYADVIKANVGNLVGVAVGNRRTVGRQGGVKAMCF